MQLHSISNCSQSSRRVWLYSVVYTGKISAYAILLLLVSFFVQPIHQAFANEDVVVAEEGENAEIVESIDEQKVTTEVITAREPETDVDNAASVVSEVGGENPAIFGEDGERDSLELSSVNSEVVENDLTDSLDMQDIESPYVPIITPEEPDSAIDTDSDVSETDTEQQLAGDGSSAASDGSVSAQSISELNPEDEIIVDGVTDIVNEVVTLTRQLVTEENYYQFSRQSCAPVGDGTFHCTVNSGIGTDPQSVVFADRGAGGNMEIFMKTSKGEVEQITDNEYDDTSPDFDAESMQIVWQRLIDGRYQIMSYNVKTEKTTQLTYSRTNNMEPKVSADGIVWQMWDGEDWEIVFFDGTYADQITNNAVQDVTPVIEDGYVLWSVLGGAEQEARVYSIKSKEILTISGYEGGAIANPRFMLVYDTKFENGDVVTQGFDPVTGLSAPIAAKPAQEPIEIPSNDPVGEIRALIQNKSISKEQKVISGTSDTASSTEGTTIGGASASSSDVLNLKSAEFDTQEIDLDAISEEGGEPEDFVLTEYDLVITPTATSSTSSRPSVHEINLAASGLAVTSSSSQP